MEIQFKVGDFVYWNISPKGGKYQIIASCDTPYLFGGNSKMYPENGYDYLLKEYNERDEFKPFISVMLNDLKRA
jgi:hypothetical protein